MTVSSIDIFNRNQWITNSNSTYTFFILKDAAAIYNQSQ